MSREPMQTAAQEITVNWTRTVAKDIYPLFQRLR